MRGTDLDIRDETTGRTHFPIGVRLAMALLLLSAFGVTATACGSAAADDPTPVQTWKITPAPAGYATSTPSNGATPTAAATTAAGGSSATISAKDANLKFDKETLTVAAGAVTITFNNQDSGIPHNFHVFEGSDAKGTSVGQTDLASGPVEQELQLNLTAGSYFYRCDAHPTTMKGTLTVQ